MPPHDYEEPQYFLKCADGGFVPFDKIQQVNMIADYGCEWISPFSDMPEEMSATFKLTHKSERLMRKMIHAFVNKSKRMKRTAIREKEKARRIRMKYGEVHI